MACSTRKTCGWIVLSLVILRLCLGWHFYREGSKKFSYDRSTETWSVDFSSEGFLRGAKGPLAGLFHSYVPGGHDWETHLAVPFQATAESSAAIDTWAKNYTKQRDARAKKKPAEPYIDYPEPMPHHAWAEKIVADQRAILKRVTSVPGLSEQQQAEAARLFEERHQQVSDFLADEVGGFEFYQHELWRLTELQSRSEVGAVPFVDERVADKASEVAGMPRPWVIAIDGITDGLRNDLATFLAEDEAAEEKLRDAVALAAADPKAEQLGRINHIVAYLTIGVGVCLLFGCFTRIAALAGAGFLASVIATQPPWVPGAADTYYQLVEFASLLVVAATGPGKWFGLDFFPAMVWKLLTKGSQD